MTPLGSRIASVRARRPGSSLRTRYVAWVLLGELAFGLAVGLTVGVYSATIAANERRASLEQISRATAAALTPMIADQDIARVQALMDSILFAADPGGITCIRVLDGTGSVIAVSALEGHMCEDPTERDSSAFAILTRSQVVHAPVVVDGFQIGSVLTEFSPPGLWQMLGGHFVAALIVVLSVALVSAPWTAWLVLRTVVEPIGELRDGARRLAEGHTDVVLDTGRRDELGELARAFDEMIRELAEKEQYLTESYARLEEAYEDQARAKEALEEIARMKSDFVAVASHELRTPLSVIRLYAEMLDEEELGDLSEESHEAISAITSASARLSSIVSDLMDAALLEKGLMPLEFSRVHVDEHVREAVKDADTLANSRGVRVMLLGEVPEVDAWVDPIRIRQLLDNLIFNAVKYSDGATEVHVRLRVLDERVEIEVTDFGRGVDERDRSILFKLFGRVDSGDGRDTIGLGLGLAISSRIAEAHGGSIVYAANPTGKGSVFTLRIPIGDADVCERDASISFFGEAKSG